MSVQIDKDLTETLDGLLAGLDSLLADRETQPTALLPRSEVAGSSTQSLDAQAQRLLTALALVAGSPALGQDFQATSLSLLRTTLQTRAQREAQQRPVSSELGRVRLADPLVLSPRWTAWLQRLAQPGLLRLSSEAADGSLLLRFDQPISEEDLSSLRLIGPLSLLVEPVWREPAGPGEGPEIRLVDELRLPRWPELAGLPKGLVWQDQRVVEGPCLIYWLDQWMAQATQICGIGLPIAADSVPGVLVRGS